MELDPNCILLSLSQHNRARKCQVYTLTPATPTPPDTTQGRVSALASLLTGKEAYCCPQHTDKPHTAPQGPSTASADNPSSPMHLSATTHEQVTSYTSRLLEEETTPTCQGCVLGCVSSFSHWNTLQHSPTGPPPSRVVNTYKLSTQTEGASRPYAQHVLMTTYSLAVRGVPTKSHIFCKTQYWQHRFPSQLQPSLDTVSTVWHAPARMLETQGGATNDTPHCSQWIATSKTLAPIKH